MEVVRFEAVVEITAVCRDNSGEIRRLPVQSVVPFVIAQDEFLFSLLSNQLGEAGREAYFRTDFETVRVELNHRLSEMQAYLDSLEPEPLPTVVVDLGRKLAKYFNMEELRTACFDLSISHDTLPHRTRPELAESLAEYCFRHKMVAELIDYCGRVRPHVDWGRDK